MKAVIFAGPSLPPAFRPVDPALEWRPPVKQGEVYEAALARPINYSQLSLPEPDTTGTDDHTGGAEEVGA